MSVEAKPIKKKKKERSSSLVESKKTKLKKKGVKKRSQSISNIEDDGEDEDFVELEVSFYDGDMRPRRGQSARVEYNEVDLREAVRIRDALYLKLDMNYKAEIIHCIGQCHYEVAKIRVKYLNKGYNPKNRMDLLTDTEFLLAHRLTIAGIQDRMKDDVEVVREPKGKAAKKLKALPKDITGKHLLPRMSAIFTLNKELLGALIEAKAAIKKLHEEIKTLTKE